MKADLNDVVGLLQNIRDQLSYIIDTLPDKEAAKQEEPEPAYIKHPKKQAAVVTDQEQNIRVTKV